MPSSVPPARLPRVVPFLLVTIGPLMTLVLLPVVLVLYAGFWSYERARAWKLDGRQAVRH